MLHLYEQKSESRDELGAGSTAGHAGAGTGDAGRSVCDHPEAEQLMQELAAGLGTVKGKKSYGYLPKRLKGLVDEIVDQMERLPVVSQCYDQWLLLRERWMATTTTKPENGKSCPRRKEFRQIKNAIIRGSGTTAVGTDHL